MDRAARVVSTPSVQGRVAQLRGRFESRRGVVRDGYEMLLAAADQLAAVEPQRAAASLVEALEAAFLAGDQAMVAELGRRVVELPTDEPIPAVEHVAGMTALLGGDADRAAPLLRSALARSQHSDDPEVLLMAAVAAGYVGDAVALAQCSRRAVAVARAAWRARHVGPDAGAVGHRGAPVPARPPRRPTPRRGCSWPARPSSRRRSPCTCPARDRCRPSAATSRLPSSAPTRSGGSPSDTG